MVGRAEARLSFLQSRMRYAIPVNNIAPIPQNNMYTIPANILISGPTNSKSKKHQKYRYDFKWHHIDVLGAMFSMCVSKNY